MPTLALSNFNIVCSALGGFISIFGLVSYLCKETFYLSECLISLLAGLIFSPKGLNLIKPLSYTHTQDNLDFTTLNFSRLVLGVQLVLAGVQLPRRYLKTEWKSLAFLLGPIMTTMWLVSGCLIWGLIPGLNFLEALAVGACVTPTDPVLSNSIVKGKFADKNIPPELQRVIIAESGANDGLGYPFLFFALYLIKYNHRAGGTGAAMRLWFAETWAYEIFLSVVYGVICGWIARVMLRWAMVKNFVDRESFLVFAISLALFIIGTCGMIGTDDVLACFIAGNVFTWDDWFRRETKDDSLQPTIDMLLNLSIFMWYGAVCPWDDFGSNDIVPSWRLVLLGLLVLLVRRLPAVFAFHTFIHQVEQKRQALYVGFFGPIGVSAIFYLYVTLEFAQGIELDGEIRSDAAKLSEAVHLLVWFLVICSVVVHGVSVPLGKLGFFLPRTISRALSTHSGQQASFPGQPMELGSKIDSGPSVGIPMPASANSTPGMGTSKVISSTLSLPQPLEHHVDNEPCEQSASDLGPTTSSAVVSNCSIRFQGEAKVQGDR